MLCINKYTYACVCMYYICIIEHKYILERKVSIPSILYYYFVKCYFKHIKIARAKI